MIVQLFPQVNPFSQKAHIGGHRDRAGGAAEPGNSPAHRRAAPEAGKAGKQRELPRGQEKQKSPGTLFGARADQGNEKGTV